MILLDYPGGLMDSQGPCKREAGRSQSEKVLEQQKKQRSICYTSNLGDGEGDISQGKQAVSRS